ncbi:MAG: hypothetical protein SGCHY_004627 [Lobulomycetales sp.]
MGQRAARSFLVIVCLGILFIFTVPLHISILPTETFSRDRDPLGSSRIPSSSQLSEDWSFSESDPLPLPADESAPAPISTPSERYQLLRVLFASESDPLPPPADESVPAPVNTPSERYQLLQALFASESDPLPQPADESVPAPVSTPSERYSQADSYQSNSSELPAEPEVFEMPEVQHFELENFLHTTQYSACPDFSSVDGMNINVCQNEEYRDKENMIRNDKKFHGDIFKLTKMYAHSNGRFWFNSSSIFTSLGCGTAKDLQPFEAPEALKVGPGISMLHKWGTNFYHTLIETMPRIFLVSRTIGFIHPILVVHSPIADVFFELIGVDPSTVQQVTVPRQSYVYSPEVYVPMMAPCGSVSSSVADEMRDVIMKTQLSDAEHATWSSVDPKKMTKDTVRVVLFLRKHSRRFEGEKEIVELLKNHYTNLETHWGDKNILEASKYFSNTHLLIAAHGAGLSNLLFLPPGAAVLEVLPNRYRNMCFVKLSRAIGLDHQQVMGVGNKKTSLSVEPVDILKKAIEILGFYC